MRPTLLIDTLKRRAMANIGLAKAGKKPLRSTHIASEPGVGKSSIIEQVATDLNKTVEGGFGFMWIAAPLTQAEDWTFPFVDKEKETIKFIVPGTDLPFEDVDCPEFGFLVIEEEAQADNSIQKILANLKQTREIRGRRLKPGWYIVSTGNRVQDRAGSNRRLSHLADRSNDIDLEVSLDDWCPWALNNGVDPVVVSFLRFRPDLLQAFDPQQNVSPTARAWVEGVAASMGVVAPEAEFECFKGDVGEGAAGEFTAFLRTYRELPNIDQVLAFPETAMVPDSPAALYAIAGAVGGHATEVNFARVMTYAKRLPPAFMVLCIRDAMIHDFGVVHTQEYVRWAANEGKDVLM